MTAPRFEGPFGYENWRAQLTNSPTTAGSEALVYSDSRFTGELTSELGPYQLVNTITMSPKGALAPVFALRIDDYLPSSVHEGVAQSLFEGQKTELMHYHGGNIYDEVVALFALSLGVRFYAGPTIRVFNNAMDPRGRPITPDDASPSLLPGRSRPIVPAIVRGECAIQAGIVKSYPDLSPRDALALIRAARSYQEAIWVADGDPQLAWLLLLSAVETAAARWFRTTNASNESDADVLRAGNPILAHLLDVAGGEQHVAAVAQHIAQGMRAGHKFREFIRCFAPKPPQPRPSPWGALDWTEPSLSNVMKKIYEHRSKALHESIPFPLPMCGPPIHMHNDDGVVAPSEKPSGLSEFSEGGFWQIADTPMLLWVFDYIVRHSLLSWWSSMIPPAAAKPISYVG